jgi:hypothetical protein
LSARGDPSFIALAVLRQQGIEHPLPVIKVRRLQAFESCGEIDQPAPGGEIEHVQRAGCGEALTARNPSHPVLIVHQHEIGSDRAGKRDNRAFAPIELGRSAIIAGADIGIGLQVEPGGRLRDPHPYRHWRFAIGKFIAHGLRHEHALEQSGQQHNIAGQHQIVKRPGIGDDEQRG